LLRGGLRECVEDFEVNNRFGAGAKRNAFVQITHAKRNRFRQRCGHFFERADERFLEGSPAVLLHGLLGHQHGKQLALGEIESWEVSHRARVKVAEF
jgi:hypothetical protein